MTMIERACCLIAWILWMPSFALADAEQPNVILFIADDISWNDFGCYGNAAARTPNIDRLAAGGIRFDQAYLTASSCSPSRASIVTGRYPHNNGAAAELHLPIALICLGSPRSSAKSAITPRYRERITCRLVLISNPRTSVLPRSTPSTADEDQTTAAGTQTG
ncbi:MAG: sulfatase-like hydrolase/transferase [Pirellulaceae bacterium]